MNHTEHFKGIKLDIQASNVTLEDGIHERIRGMLSRLGRIFSEISYADVHFENKNGKSTNQKSVSVRLGIPGNDAFASDEGENYYAILSSVEDKLRSQLTKR